MTYAFLKVTVAKLHNEKKLAYEKKKGRDTALKNFMYQGRKKVGNLINMTAQFYTCQKARNYLNTTTMAHCIEKDLKFAFGTWHQKGCSL